MRLAIVSYGTRGDVQPMMALALALHERGHEVVLGVPENHVGFAQSTGLRVLPLAGDSEALLNSAEGRRWLTRGNIASLLDAIVNQLAVLADRLEHDISVLTAGADVIVSGNLAASMARVFADRQRIPLLVAHLLPGLPSRELAHAAFSPPAWTPGFVRKGLTELLMALLWRRVGGLDTRIRQRHSLPPAREEAAMELWRRGIPSIHMWSPNLVPKPGDWPNERLTGFCRLPASLRTSLGETAALQDIEPFMNDDDPPIYVGLGSMPVLADGQGLQAMLDATARLGLRVLIGGTVPDRERVRAMLPSHARLVGPVDHDVLFARCQLIVHHGGAGTTAASGFAGRPVLVAPVLGDQWFWGRALQRNGSAQVLPFREWTAGRLEPLLAGLLTPDSIGRAAVLGERMRAEPDGASLSALAIEHWVREQTRAS
jgi:sterol 3beta-glucosyltransferase